MVSDGIFEDIKMQKADSLIMVDKVLFIDTFSHDMEFTHLGEQLLEQMAAMGMGLMDLGVSSALGMEAYVLLVQVMNDCIADMKETNGNLYVMILIVAKMFYY
ncbi:MAG: hypothetical protein methR_P3789 [Methyloprofundus sp.]|nr:MAG: hypothetical protein methR_P3789 [Methyloprofundus sp.]